jgi:hypothetical protein
MASFLPPFPCGSLIAQLYTGTRKNGRSAAIYRPESYEEWAKSPTRKLDLWPMRLLPIVAILLVEAKEGAEND